MVGEEMDGRFLTQEVVNPLRTGSFFLNRIGDINQKTLN